MVSYRFVYIQKAISCLDVAYCVLANHILDGEAYGKLCVSVKTVNP